MERKKYRVLITGANSYIGTNFENWVKEYGAAITTETQDMIGDAWKERDFHGYDTVFHVAGIAHADVGMVTEEQKALYYKVNTDLTIQCAQKAKADGVKQFIFMSSIIVYGESAGIGKEKVITKETPLKPANFYGDSKVKAEEGLQKLVDENFKVVILRPPMIYGKDSKGNYPLLAKLAKKLPFFPDVQNQRSMLYIGNLCKFIGLMIENEESGIFFPQNAEYVRTGEMVREIAKAHNRKIHLIKIFNPTLRLLGKMGNKANGKPGKLGGMVNKAFGNMVYDKTMSEYREEYRIYGLEESVRLTEVG
ncbi:MAG: NAD-dependent epimerase/dehydratase family protein [Acetatifactor sp.]